MRQKFIYSKVFDPKQCFQPCRSKKDKNKIQREHTLYDDVSVLISSDKPNAVSAVLQAEKGACLQAQTQRTSYHSSKAIGYMPPAL